MRDIGNLPNPESVGRKVGDEFTVLCQSRHQELHRHSNEQAWQADIKIAPLPIAYAMGKQPGPSVRDGGPSKRRLGRCSIESTPARNALFKI